MQEIVDTGKLGPADRRIVFRDSRQNWSCPSTEVGQVFGAAQLPDSEEEYSTAGKRVQSSPKNITF